MLLVGDIGATKVHLALYRRVGGVLESVRTARFATGEFHGLETVVGLFLRADKVSAACLGAPGPVKDGRSQMANSPWLIDSHKLSAELGIERVYLLNDLEAHGYGIASLSANQMRILNEGDARRMGSRALIAAGTGLGESFLMWDGHAHIPHASEGGHADFAPRNDDECDLLGYLRRKYGGRVSVERVVSGIGLGNIFEFLKNERRMEEPAWLAEEIAGAEDPNSVITQTAFTGRSALCEKTLEIFVSAYGAEAGNFALRALSVGGLYIGGGIAPRILEKLGDGTFMRAFTDKGRLKGVLMEMPVRVILDGNVALMGAAAYAEARLADGVFNP